MKETYEKCFRRKENGRCDAENYYRKLYLAAAEALAATDFTAFSASTFSCANWGSKQRRQRASYIPPAPTTIKSSDATKRCVCAAGLPQRMQIARSLVISSASARRRGMGSNGRPR